MNRELVFHRITNFFTELANLTSAVIKLFDNFMYFKNAIKSSRKEHKEYTVNRTIGFN